MCGSRGARAGRRRPAPGRGPCGGPPRGPRAPAPVDHRPLSRGQSAHDQRGWDDPADLQRRDLQLQRAAPRARGQGAPLPQRLGHRGRHSPLRGGGCGGRPAPERHVRLRPLGRETAAPVALPRPHRDQAAGLLLGRRPPALRLGDPGAADGPGGRPDPRPRRAHALPGLQLCAGPADDVRGDPQARARLFAGARGRPGRDLALLGPARTPRRTRSRPTPTGWSTCCPRPWPAACWPTCPSALF